MAKRISGSVRTKRIIMDIIVHIFLVIVAIIWLIPFVWLIAHSFRKDQGQFVKTFFPTQFTFDNYKALFTDFDVINFPRMFMNTFFIASCSGCLLHQPSEVEDAQALYEHVHDYHPVPRLYVHGGDLLPAEDLWSD